MRLTGYVYIYKSDATMSKSLGVTFTDDATKKKYSNLIICASYL